MKNIFLVDMDETLLDFKRAERVNLTQSLGRYGIQADEELIQSYHEINDALWKALERGEITRERLKVRRFELLFEKYGFSQNADEVGYAYWSNFPSVCFPFEGAVEFLKTLSERGRVYIVTNGGALIQKRHLLDGGFLPYIQRAFISEEIGFNKPSIEYADFVESQIPDYDRTRAVWIGDSLSSDGKCAENRGIDFILFTPSGAPQDYHGAVARNYREVLALCEREFN